MASSHQSLDPPNLLSHFTLEPILGSGSFGAVYEAHKKPSSSESLGVTQLPLIPGQEPRLETTFALKLVPKVTLREVVAMSGLVHPNLLTCYNVWMEDDPKAKNSLIPAKFCPSSSQYSKTSDTTSTSESGHETQETIFESSFLVLQLPFCKEGTLEGWLFPKKTDPKSSPPQLPPRYQTDAEKRWVFTQLVDAFVYLETKEVVHGDLKLSNVLLHRHPRTEEIMPRLSDFGLTHKNAWQAVLQGLDWQDSDLLTRQQSRFLFMCPVQAGLGSQFGEEYGVVAGASHRSDVYSLGLIWLCLLLDGRTFKKENEWRGVVFDAMEEETKDKKRSWPSGWDTEYPQELFCIGRMIDWELGKRPVATQVQDFLEHVTMARYRRISAPEDYTQKRLEIEHMTEIYERISDKSEAGIEIHPALLPLKRRRYSFLIQILSLCEQYLDPGMVEDQDLWWRVILHYQLYEEDHPSENGTRDRVYWFRKLIKKCENSPLEIAKVLMMKLNLALNLTSIPDREEAISLLESVVNCPVYNALDSFDPLRLDVPVALWDYKFKHIVGHDPSKLTPEEISSLEEALSKAEDMLADLENIKGMVPLHSGEARSIFTTMVQLLTKLGKTREAETKLKEAYKSYTPDYDNSSKNLDPLPPYYYNIVVKDCQFLSEMDRGEEAMEIMEKMQRLHIAQNNTLHAINALHHLAGFAFTHEDKREPGVISQASFREADSNLPRFYKYLEQLYKLDSDLYKSGNLLQNGSPNQGQLEAWEAAHLANNLASKSTSFSIVYSE